LRPPPREKETRPPQNYVNKGGRRTGRAGPHRKEGFWGPEKKSNSERSEGKKRGAKQDLAETLWGRRSRKLQEGIKGAPETKKAQGWCNGAPTENLAKKLRQGGGQMYAQVVRSLGKKGKASLLMRKGKEPGEQKKRDSLHPEGGDQRRTTSSQETRGGPRSCEKKRWWPHNRKQEKGCALLRKRQGEEKGKEPGRKKGGGGDASNTIPEAN